MPDTGTPMHHASEKVSAVPRTIWIMWSSGLPSAPDVVKACVASWQRQNPDWDLKFFDRSQAGELLDVEQITGSRLSELDPVVLADLLRMHLLAEHGGVWVDSTCYCTKPLDQWLSPMLTTGFFAFRDPGPDRLLSTWFLASQPGHTLTKAWRNRAMAYWRTYRFAMPRSPSFVHDQLLRVLSTNVRRTRWWFSWPVARLLGDFPYFWLHYQFACVLEGDPEAAAIWQATPEVNAREAHVLQFEGNGLARTMTEQTRRAWEEMSSPIFKLSHKWAGTYDPGSPLDLVINHRP